MTKLETLQDGTLVLDQPVTMPAVLDVLIVGGGPLGTAAAFRAKELGLSALVIDYDELMKRIRDYPKDKQILPDFGGGDQMQFPKGGDLIAALQFGPVDKDDLCVEWKALYRRFNVPALIGAELVGLQRVGQAWNARIWNHNLKSEATLSATHVVIGVGRGVPRRLDIPGNVDGIAFQLSDAAKYVGRPVCVLGGGTSAAEAVIAISNAKVAASDESPVYWSYRGDKMPKVSKALADVFFEAYLGNGNVRYLPKSDPTAVMAGFDGTDCLCIRIDRKTVANRPSETVHLEFAKTDCIACIGEDIPEALLNSFGIFLMAGGPSAKKRMAVSPLLESGLPNVYLTGDMLSPVYLEAEDFDADPASFRELKRRGNIKAALRDGVFVMEVIAQKLAGKAEIDVELEFAEEVPRSTAPAATVIAAAKATSGGVRGATPRSTPTLIRLLPGNVEADQYPIGDKGVSIGRLGCDVSFPDDTHMSDRHASIVQGPDGYVLRDEGSVNGLFLRLVPRMPLDLPRGGILRAGRNWVVRTGDRLVSHYDGAGRKIADHPLRDGTMVVGRDAPDITLDPDDPSLSRRHFSLAVSAGRVQVNDLGSANGTMFKVASPITLRGGEQICAGGQVLEFSFPETQAAPSSIVKRKNVQAASPQAAPAPAPVASAPARTPAVAATPAPAPAATPSGPSVTFASSGLSCPIRKDQTICQIAEERGVKIQADCHQGICGSDPIRIVSGAEFLTKMSAEERSAVEDICSLSPSDHRLACMARVTGPVVVEIV